MFNFTISQILARADLLVDRPSIDVAIAHIADDIARDYQGMCRCLSPSCMVGCRLRVN